VAPCELPATAPRTNRELLRALDVTRAAWAECANRVDMIVACQAKGSADADQGGTDE
jgi:hypothetical protein